MRYLLCYVKDWSLLLLVYVLSNYAFPVSGTRKRNTLSVTLSGTGTGLGLLIVGGRNIHSADNYTGVFIKKLMPNLLADRDGKIASINIIC